MRNVLLMMGLLWGGGFSAACAADPAVVVNGHEVKGAVLHQLEQTYGVAPTPGTYWYDSRSGLYGWIGGPAVGRLQPGHDFGPLQPDASRGTTGVFLNGRHLPVAELRGYQAALGTIEPGRYWLDGSGDAGREGDETPLVNLFGTGPSAKASAPAPAPSAKPTKKTPTRSGAPQSSMSYTDGEGYTWLRYMLSCRLPEGAATLVLDVSEIDDAGIVWDTSKRPTPEISAVIGTGQKIRYLKGEVRVNGQVHRFTGRGQHFSFRETLDNSMSGRFELHGSRLAVFYPFDNPTPSYCTLDP